MQSSLELGHELLELLDHCVRLPPTWSVGKRLPFAGDGSRVLPLHVDELTKRIVRALIALTHTRSAF